MAKKSSKESEEKPYVEPAWRLKLIEDIKSGRAKGSLEESEKYGTIIVRTSQEAREYNNRFIDKTGNSNHEFWSNPKGE